MFKFCKQVQARRKMPATQAEGIHWHKSFVWVFLIPPIILAGFLVARMDPIMPIRSIQLSGTFENLDQREVEAALQEYLGRGFFSLDIHELQQSLHAKSWTESVSVRRIWPDRISVTIVEKEPVARWDGRHLLSDKARVYRADTGEFSHLPVVYAASHNPAWVLNQFYRLEARFGGVDEQLISLRVDSRGALDVELINGLVSKLGRNDIERKIDRLMSIYNEQILPRREQIQRLDLRYSNGFAVAWKKEALRGRDEASIWSNSNV